MSTASTEFARKVVDALNRIEPSQVNRGGGSAGDNQITIARLR